MTETFGLNEYRFSKSKWILLGVSALMVVVGITIAGGWPRNSTPNQDLSVASSSDRQSRSSGSDIFGNSFAESLPVPDSENISSPPDESVTSQDFSAFLVKGGFGAFIGFAIGFALRSFVRLAMVIIGFYLLTLTLMSYTGWIEIHWTLMQEQFNHSITTLGDQFTSFQQFLTGAIPSTGMAALGLSLGLRKR